jgi:hypothetical protein
VVRVDGALDVGLRLRLIEFPEKAQGRERLGIEFDPQVHQGKIVFMDDQQRGGFDLLLFAARSETGFEGL